MTTAHSSTLALAATVEERRSRPALPPERLLYPAIPTRRGGCGPSMAPPLAARCNCSREPVEGMLDQSRRTTWLDGR